MLNNWVHYLRNLKKLQVYIDIKVFTLNLKISKHLFGTLIPLTRLQIFAITIPCIIRYDTHKYGTNDLSKSKSVVQWHGF